MKKIAVLMDMPVDEAALAALKASNEFQLKCIPGPETPHAVDPELIRDVDAIFCTYPPTNHDDLKALKWIQIASTGYSQLFGLSLSARGVRVTNSRGCFDTPIAEWNIAMMVNLARNLRQLIRNQEAGIWDRSAVFQKEIRGMIVGLWGYGGIGRETARLARAIGMRVYVLTRRGVRPRDVVYTISGTGDPEGVLPDRSFEAGQEIQFLSELDFLIVGLPLTKATDGLIGERELQALPRTAYLLNPARGPIIKQEALLRALREQWIAGAALDTHYQYPLPSDHPLWKFENVILTPHISGSSLTQSYKKRLWDIFSINVGRYVRSEPLLNELTTAQLDGA